VAFPFLQACQHIRYEGSATLTVVLPVVTLGNILRLVVEWDGTAALPTVPGTFISSGPATPSSSIYKFANSWLEASIAIAGSRTINVIATTPGLACSCRLEEWLVGTTPTPI
jgi:hypothetical protein